jgi:hypothetical protein
MFNDLILFSIQGDIISVLFAVTVQRVTPDILRAMNNKTLSSGM